MRRLLAVLALCLPAVALGAAADTCVITGGTATSGTCATTSCDSSEWVDTGVCYPATQTGLNNALIAAATAGDGSFVTLDTGLTVAMTTGMTTSGMAASTGTVGIRCRTASRGNCGVTSSGATSPFIQFNDTDANNFTITNLGFACAVTKTSTTASPILHVTGSGTGNITLTSVYVHDCTWDFTGSTSTTGLVVNMGSGASNKTVTFAGDSLIDTISVTANSASSLIKMGGTNDIVTSGTLTITNVTSAGMAALLELNDSSTIDGLQIGDSAQTGWTATEVTADVIQGAVYSPEASLTLTISNSWIKNSTITGDSPRGGFLDAAGPVTASNIVCDGITVTGTTTTQPSSPCLFLTTAGALTGTNITLSNSSGVYGGLFYVSQGGSATVSRGLVTNSQLASGILAYCGGWGDCTINSSLAVGNTQIDGGEVDYGGVWYCQLHTSASRDRTCTLNNSVLANNTLLDASLGSVVMRNTVTNDTGCGGATCDQTMTIQNSVIRNSATNEIGLSQLDANPTNTLNLTTNNLTDSSNPTVELASNVGSTTTNSTGNIQTDPAFPCNGAAAACYKLSSASPLRGTGTELTSPTSDYRGWRFNLPRNIGAYTLGSGDAAAARTARTQ